MSERAQTTVPLRWRLPFKDTTRADAAQRRRRDGGETGNGTCVQWAVEAAIVLARDRRRVRGLPFISA